MKNYRQLLSLLTVFAVLAGCSTPEEKADFQWLARAIREWCFRTKHLQAL
jgi:hypothetical protein